MNTSTHHFEVACAQILAAHPEAIGVAFKWLDCGCALICGVSAKGSPVGQLTHVNGQPSVRGRRQPVCLQCKRDSGLERVVWQGIHWPGAENEKPERQLRIAIGRSVFGPEYLEE